MAEEKSINRDIVALRWPDAHPIFGNGAFAILSRCPARPFVRLFETAPEAQAQLRAECGHAFCKELHQFVRLDEIHRTIPPVVFRKKARWFRDLDK